MSPVESASPEDVVRQFCSLVSRRDAELLRPLLDDGVVYHNIGMPASEGAEATLANLAGQWAMFPDAYEFEVRHLAANGTAVLTERIDRIGVGTVATVPVMGTFEVRDGRITHWRDYFDTALVGKLMAGEDTTGLIS
jgi:limonene-1,2-epoxide hydrolase